MTSKSLLSLLFLLMSLEVSAQSNPDQKTVPPAQPGAVQEAGSGEAKPMAVKVLYTGNMFGYFRLPDQQSTKLKKCPQDSSAASPEGRVLLDAVLQKPNDHILLGMGNNFSPELYSRYMTDGNGKKFNRDLFTWDYAAAAGTNWVLNEDAADTTTDDMAKGNGRIPADNVACFISRAGYTAIVPGKHDFYFGPEYLRYLARLLASPQVGNVTDGTPAGPRADRNSQPASLPAAPQTDTYKPVQMLGANLVIQTTVDHAAKRIPYQDKSPRPAYSNDSGDLKFVVPATVLPWARTLKIKNASSATSLYICPAGKEQPRDPDQTEKNCPDRRPLTRIDQDTYKFPGDDNKGHTFLSPNGDYLLCAENPPNRRDPKEKHPYCQQLSVSSPFFMYRSDINLIPAPEASRRAFDALQGAPYEPQYRNPEPYAMGNVQVDNSHQATPVAVFGVVDPELNEHIGRLNYAWMAPRQHLNYSTEVKVIDPVEALQQLLEYFKEAEPNFQGFKILLAQMPAYKARRIAAMMPGEFSLIVAEADLEEATPDKDETIRIPASSRGPASPTFLTVPAPFYDDRARNNNNALTLQLRSAVVSRENDCANGNPCGWKWNLRNIPETAAPMPQPQVRLFADIGFQTLVSQARNTYLHKPPVKPLTEEDAIKLLQSLTEDDAIKQLEELTLAIMQERKSTDIALLQKRDLFSAYVEINPKNKLQETLDRVFWKGDYLLDTRVRGDTLKKVMVRSKQFDDDDASSLSLSDEKKRGLVTLGIFLDPASSQYIVNGEPLDDNKLYSLATTDYIALGDTGYSDLLKPAVGAPEKPSASANLRSISGLVCGKIRDANQDLKNAQCNDAPISGKDYFDTLHQSPFDATPGFTPARHLLSWAKFLKPRPPLYKGVSRVEEQSQQRPVWTVSLSKLSLGFTLNQHNNGTEANLAGLFAGISVPQVTAPNTNTTTIDSSMRFQRSSQHFELYEQNDVSYSRQLTRQSDPANSDLEAQLKNQLAFEAGILTRLPPSLKQRPDWKALVAMRYEENLVPPLTAFKLGLTPPVVLRGKIPRRQTFLGKYGFRLDNQKSFLEAGIEVGEAFSVPVAFNFTPGVPCAATQAKKAESLATCVSKNSLTSAGPILASSQFAAVTTDRPRDGLFLNFKMTMPLPFNDGLAYVMENKGEFFFNRSGDFSVDTKFQDDWTHSLIIPLWGNLSFVPKLEWFFYQNKVDNNYFRSLQTSLTLQYKFDWRPGLRWKHALAYRSP